MVHTRGGGIGNMAGSYDHARAEVIEELASASSREAAMAISPEDGLGPADW
ncbi:hypothetical protein [Bradyrhizobium sp. BRP23]|uniref:hypothetical protein n=1 Tax=Bradyrhizobium sp. BRP23 TaxID=2793820 RepID=UPI001CD71C0B|nr:hypothetical protein [Bradyrhizobium sp. BRP23]MCA1381467.1 hypothetical protein [Bradyrhizobium sp. BRP05]MCA1422277.1 hypothetical protein [Bradyrhizobium sp. BRP23]